MRIIIRLLFTNHGKNYCSNVSCVLHPPMLKIKFLHCIRMVLYKNLKIDVEGTIYFIVICSETIAKHL